MRDLRVEVQPRQAGAVAVTGLSAIGTRDGGAEVAFSLSAEATVDVSVLNIAGRLVRRLAADEVLSAGAQRLQWNGCDASGARVPSGRYLIAVSAKTAGGQLVRRMAPVALAR